MPWMRHLLGVGVAGVILALAACGDDDDPNVAGGPDGAVPPPGSGSDAQGGRDSSRPPLPDGAKPDACVPTTAPKKKVFLNKAGGTYTQGQNDGRANTAPDLTKSLTVPAWAADDAKLAKMITCLEKKFSGLNVEFTDVDPGSDDHIEIVFAPTDAHVFGEPPTTAIQYTANCSNQANMVAFIAYPSFDQTLNYVRGCGTVGQAVARAYGAETVYEEFDAGGGEDCSDAMDARIGSCPDKPFTSTPFTCGTNGGPSVKCTCTDGTTQASFDLLAGTIGVSCTQNQ